MEKDEHFKTKFVNTDIDQYSVFSICVNLFDDTLRYTKIGKLKLSRYGEYYFSSRIFTSIDFTTMEQITKQMKKLNEELKHG